ncbi:hypothetical protein ALI144C_11665 [Actinosynnema sp. ALI-1.44]|nr:hypothetical protein ALI144C_11665 [Actinosynnema sp. ALI-1.44]
MVALATAGMLIPAAHAFAAPTHPLAGPGDAQVGAVNTTNDHTEQFGVLNTGELSVADTVTIPVCLNDTNVNVGILVAVLVDVLSPSGQTGSCSSGVLQDNGGH